MEGIATYLTGMSIGIGLSVLPFNTPGSIPVFITFAGLASMHVYASYQALSSVSLRTLNMQRTSLLVDEYFAKQNISTPEAIRHTERIITTPLYLRHPTIILGATIAESFGPKMAQLEQHISIFKEMKYLLNYHNKNVYIVLREDATSTDTLQSYFTACYLRNKIQTNYVNTPASPIYQFWRNTDRTDASPLLQWIEESINYSKENFDNFFKLLETKNWNTTHLLLLPQHNRASWALTS
jgi:hypothetical protein